ncbi:MAG: glutamine-hydrolyzing GMP synthase [Bacteroidales bacterium]|nr:glutamine-hydrolyzing GMP synthase [Bacteroidales bacterium]
MNDKIIILDFGSQYTQLIARKVRELNVFCEIYPFNKNFDLDNTIKGIVLSGSPFSVKDKKAPVIDLSKFRGRLPILGICYGAQLIADLSGGKVMASEVREYGRANLMQINNEDKLFNNVPVNSQVWMSHGDTISELPGNFCITAGTKEVKIAGFKIDNEDTYGIQFHPEVYHTTEGKLLLKNFLLNICKLKSDWTAGSFIDATIRNLKETIKNEKVVLGLSGGVDSTVAAVLLTKAISDNLYCIFVDNGLLRKDEFQQVLNSYKDMGLNVTGVDAGTFFINALKGISNPEEKRKIIGATFIKVFDDEAHKIKDVSWLAQGTIYPDVIESASVNGPSATIKSHHNVGGLPDFMKLKIVEPLKFLFKDEVRRVGKELGINEYFLNRHPFPGPGLSIRIIGDITEEKIKLLQEVDNIFIQGLKNFNLYDKIWQAAAILLPVQTVGVMGDERTYQNVVALRAVSSTDGMTADWVHLPYNFMAFISNEIINKVKGVNRVVYDISSKPPATIEWE